MCVKLDLKHGLDLDNAGVPWDVLLRQFSYYTPAGQAGVLFLPRLNPLLFEIWVLHELFKALGFASGRDRISIIVVPF